ncbi:MAG: glycosyltransferase family 2 protein [Schleiferiaceae bacterium]
MSTENLTKYFAAVNRPEKPMVSIIVPVYNMKPHLDQFLQCCIQFYTLFSYELIFVDNNSNDGSREHLEKLGARVETETRQGVNYARQHGLDLARGEVILTMDADTIYPPDYINNMVLELYADADVSLVWATSIGCLDPANPTFSEAIKLKIKSLSHRLLTNKTAQAKAVGACAMCFMKNTGVYYPLDLKNLAGCDDGMVAVQLMRKGKIKRMRKGLYTTRGLNKRIGSGTWPLD